MADWNGAARSNYVHLTNVSAVMAELTPFAIELSRGKNDTFCFLSVTDDGGWPSVSWDDEYNETEFTWEHNVMPFVREGEVLVAMQSGHEKLRYITGHAEAYVRHHDEVKMTNLSLGDIYAKAAELFGLDKLNISAVEY